MRCEKCDFSNPAGMQFCGNCAAPLPQHCAHCRHDNPPNFRFCGYCGQQLAGARERQLTPAEQGVAVGGAGEGRQKDSLQLAGSAERRQLTVMFVDLVGSSTLSERLDPEELREIITIYRDQSQQVMQQYSGHIAQYLGDGILAYFGYPNAGEGDTKRGVRAALALIEALTKLEGSLQEKFGINLQVRVGIHTGLVVIGETSAAESDRLALGEAPNIAARLQGLAQPNMVCISGATRSLIGEDFQVQSLGRHSLKGFTQPVEVFTVLEETEFLQRRTTRTPQNATPLVGREQERGLMLDRLDQAVEGTGQVVCLSGEPGIGKTRLIQEIHQPLSGVEHFYIELQGIAYYRNSPFHAITSYLCRAFKLHHGLSNEEKLANIHHAFRENSLDGEQEIAALCRLLGVTYRLQDDSEAQAASSSKRKTINTLFNIIQKMAEGRLLVLVVDDAQWIDPSTLELVGMMVDQAPLWKMFILLSFRNDFQLPWKQQANFTYIMLNRLSRRQVGRLINTMAGGKRLPDELFRDVIAKTDGIPLFVEELLKTILGSGKLIEGDESFELADLSYALKIPATLQDLLMANIDKLGDEKELAQLVATLGREFIYELLRAVVPMDEDKLQKQLKDLVNSDLLQQRGLPPEASYTFRQALLQETAYQSLLKSTRQDYHRRIAGIIKQRFPDKIVSQPEVYAHHLMECGDPQAALPFWIQAGRQALDRFANLEAAAHLNRALDILRRQPDSEQRLQQELECLLLLGQTLVMGKGYTATQVEEVFSQAARLSADLQRINIKFPAIAGLWRYYYTRGDLTTARELAGQLLAMNDGGDDAMQRVEADRIMGCTLFWQGELVSADSYLQAALSAGQASAGSADICRQFSQDPRVATLSNAALVKWFLGDKALALQLARESIVLAKTLQHPFSIAYALHFAAIIVGDFCGEISTARQYVEEELRLSEQYGYNFWLAAGGMLQAWLARSRDPQAALQKFEEAMAAFRHIGGTLGQTYFLNLQAQMYLEAGKLEAADKTVQSALQAAAQTREMCFYPELLRIKALVVAALGGDNIGDFLQTAGKVIESSGGVALAERLQSTVDRLGIRQSPPRYH